MFRINANCFRETCRKFLRLFCTMTVILRFVGDERIVLPNRHAIFAPITAKCISRQRFAWIPFTLAVVEQRAGRKFFSKTLDEVAGERALFVRHRGEVPFWPVRIVHGNERRLAAHREAHVALFQIGINRVAERLNFPPLLVGVRLGDARRFVNARHRHCEVELRFALVHAAADGRGT